MQKMFPSLQWTLSMPKQTCVSPSESPLPFKFYFAGELVAYHSDQPITVVGGELLRFPCARTEALPAICQGLGLMEHAR